MKPRLTAMAALALLMLPVATACATHHTHHSSTRTAVVPVCAHVQHGVTVDYVQRGHRPCVLPSPVVHHHRRMPTSARTSTAVVGAHTAAITARPATTAAPRLSKTPAPVHKFVKAPPAAPRPAPRSPRKLSRIR